MFQPQPVQAFSFAGSNYRYGQRIKDADTTGTSDNIRYARIRYVSPLHSAYTYTTSIIAWVQKTDLVDPFPAK